MFTTFQSCSMDVLPEGQIKLPKRKTLTLTLRVTLVLIVTLVIFFVPPPGTFCLVCPIISLVSKIGLRVDLQEGVQVATVLCVIVNTITQRHRACLHGSLVG